MITDDFVTALLKIRPHTTSKQDHQRKPAQLLVALESTLRETSNPIKSSEQSPTAYFAALITTLEGCLSRGDTTLNEGDTLPAILYLLALVFPFVPEPVLRSHMSKTFQIIPPLLPLAIPSHAPSLRSLITIFGTAIAAMDQGQILATVSSSVDSPSSAISVSIRQTFSTILELVIDPRPKVRKRAGDVIKTVLENPPTPLFTHPWSSLVAEWSCGAVAQVAEVGSSRKGGGSSEGLERLIHLFAFLRTVPSIFASNSSSEGDNGSGDGNLEIITRYLLTMPKLSNPYLTQSSYQLLTALLSSGMDEDDNQEESVFAQRRRSQVQSILRTLLSNVPSKIDHQIAPYWLNVISQATIASYSTNLWTTTTSSDVSEIWNTIWAFLDSSCSADTRGAAADALERIITGRCIAIEEMQGVASQGSRFMASAVDLLVKSIPQLMFSSSITEILNVAATIAEASSPLHRSYNFEPGSTNNQVDQLVPISNPVKHHEMTKANHPLLPLLEVVIKLRNSKGFEYKEDADRFLSAMMRAVGVDGAFLRAPLGLLPSERTMSGKQPNAYLLPLIPAHHPTPLSHFAEYFIPLSEALWELADKSEKDAEKKVYRVLMEQVWNAFPSYCWGCWDLRETFTPKLAERLTHVIYHEPTLRNSILRGLKALVDGNAAALNISTEGKYDTDNDSGDGDESYSQVGSDFAGDRIDPNTSRKDEDVPLISKEEARKNIEYLNKQAKSWLAVLFNVFTGMDKDSRGMAGEVISAWAGIANEPELAGAYQNVLSHLKQNLATMTTTSSKQSQMAKAQKESKVAHQMLDILLLLIPFLPMAQLLEVVNLCLEKRVAEHPDGSIQKLGYRVLGRVVVRIAEEDEEEDRKHTVVEKVLSEAGSGVEVTTSAVKERLTLLTLVIPYIRPGSLHLLVAHLMEAIMGVKEHSEKSRKAAFNLLVVMGGRMGQGGSIRMDLINGSGNLDAEGMEREASIEEFVKMVGASLAADKAHTISAGIMSLSRVLFEFKDDLSEAYQEDIVATVYPLLGVKNREIVKSVLGFVKLSIHSLSSNIVQPQLNTLVPALLECLAAHRHHFKVKIRHIFERLLRKYGADEIERHVLHGDHRNDGGLKMILNIKKRKDRAARKRREGVTQDDDSEDDARQKTITGDAFEDVLYGSESEIEDSDREGGTHELPRRSGRDGKQTKKKGRVDDETRLRVDDEEPLDLLDGTIGRLTISGGARRRKPGHEASKFKTDDDTGKMIIADSESESDAGVIEAKRKPSVNEALAGAAYNETMVSVDGFRRNPNGTIKFHKDTKKQRKEEMDMDVDMDPDDTAGNKRSNLGPQRTPKKKLAKLGQEFKAKRAGGDIKRKGVDPYAYLTLGQAAGGRKGRGRANVSIVGK